MRLRTSVMTTAAALAATGLLVTATPVTPASAAPPRTATAAERDPWHLVDRSPDLVRPKSLTVDASLPTHRARTAVRVTQRLYTFWNTGRARYLAGTVDPRFRDNTLPAGRPQGPAGLAFASKNFRAAVPDLTCELSDVLISGDKITARLVFRGHFTGTFQGRAGRGQKVEFAAIDIQHLGDDGLIVEDWHIEDNQTLLAQLGA